MTTPTSVFDAIANYRTGVNTQFANQQNAGISTLVSSGKQINPLWVSDYPIGDVSYPMILNASGWLGGSTAAQTAGTAHTHPLAGTNAGASGAFWPISQNNSLGAYIVMTDTYQVWALEFAGYISSAMAGGTIDVELFRENPDTSLTRIAFWQYSSGLPTSATRWSIPFTNALIARKGEKYICRIANRSSPARTFNMLGITQGLNVGVATVTHATVGATDTNKTSYTIAEAATAWAATSTIPWFLLGGDENLVEDRTFTDDFNRINLGPSWNTGGTGTDGPVALSSNRMSYSGTTGSVQPVFCIYPTATDAMRIDVDLWDVGPAAVGIMLCLDRDRQSFAWLDVTNTTATIYSVVAASATSRASVSINSGIGRWSFYYEPTPKKYTVLKDEQSVALTWTDSTPVVSHGLNYRYGGLIMQRASGVNGGTADNFVLRDWAP